MRIVIVCISSLHELEEGIFLALDLHIVSRYSGKRCTIKSYNHHQQCSNYYELNTNANVAKVILADILKIYLSIYIPRVILAEILEL